MTTRLKTLMFAGAACALVWYMIAVAVMGQSQQTCEQFTNPETCQWELR